MELEEGTGEVEAEEVDAAVAEYEAQQGGAGLPEAKDISPKEEYQTNESACPERKKEPATVARHIEPTKEQSMALDAVLEKTSSMLQKLEAEISVLEKTIKMLPRENERLQNTTAQIECVANGLSGDIREKSLEQYQGILRNVGENFNRLQQEADRWQKEHSKALHKKQERSHTAVLWSAVSVPMLMAIFFAYFMWRQ